MRSFLVLFVAVMATVLVTSCQKIAGFKEFSVRAAQPDAGKTPVARACTSEKDCPGDVCVVGFCRPKCDNDATCVDGQLCISSGGTSGCRLATEVSCADVGSACPASPGLRCALDHSCRLPCSTTSDCGIDTQACIAGTCVGRDEPGSKHHWFECETGHSCTGDGGTSLVSCNETTDGPTVVAVCKSADLCEAGKTAGACAEPSCTPGSTRCAARAVEECSVDGAHFVAKFAACASDALCELTRGQTAATGCVAPACSPNDVRCHDGAAETCATDLTKFEGAPCSAPHARCNPGTGACIALPIDEKEVTRAAYAAFVASPTKPAAPPACSWNTSFAPDPTCLGGAGVCSTGCDDHPQVCVDWCDAWSYCAAHGQHLCGRMDGGVLAFDEFANPALSEWTNACTSGGQYAFPYGDSVVNQNCEGQIRANENGNSTVPTGSATACHSPVASYAPILDLSGNAAEWEDSCNKAASGAGASASDECHARGGHFGSNNDELSCGASSTLRRDATTPSVGFRCCG